MVIIIYVNGSVIYTLTFSESSSDSNICSLAATVPANFDLFLIIEPYLNNIKGIEDNTKATIPIVKEAHLNPIPSYHCRITIIIIPPVMFLTNEIAAKLDEANGP